MAAPLRNAENVIKGDSSIAEYMDNIQSSLETASFSAVDSSEIEMLRSRIDEQSNLIGILKQRADELLLRYQALQTINAELEDKVTDCQEELDAERQKAEIVKKRFMDLAANNQAVIIFMEEYKNENAQLKMENKQLQAENEMLFCQKLQDKEVTIQNLMGEIKVLTDKYKGEENEYRRKLDEYKAKLIEQVTKHQAKEASLLDQLLDAQQQQRDAAEMCKELKIKLQNAKEEHVLEEINMRESIIGLTKEKDKLLTLSMERGRAIQEKQEEIHQLEKELNNEKKARAEAEDKFEQEAEAVNSDAKVKSLQSAFHESTTKYEELIRDFEAFKTHSVSLLRQERELNRKLLHMTG